MQTSVKHNLPSHKNIPKSATGNSLQSLLRHYGIATRLLALHEHNERQAAQKLIDLLAAGKSVALVSDAGTPAISDPGALAVAAVRAAGYPVVALPGANAAMCALAASGSASSHFLFFGFLPQQSAARRRCCRYAGQTARCSAVRR